MLRSSCGLLNVWMNKSWAVGSAGQKHFSLNPTVYLYRIEGKEQDGPGYFVSKSLNTLGNEPTGLKVPFRLREFIMFYKNSHVPVEVEEWLQTVAEDPSKSICQTVAKIIKALEGVPRQSSHAGYNARLPMIGVCLEPLSRLTDLIGVTVSPFCVRAIAARPALKEAVLEQLYDYTTAVNKNGSTPHARVIAQLMNEGSEKIEDGVKDRRDDELYLPWKSGNSIDESFDDMAVEVSSASLSELKSEKFHRGPPDYSMPDELALIDLFTTLAQGALEEGRSDASEKVLDNNLFFAFDDSTRASVNANIAAVKNVNGRFSEAERIARESVLLQPSPKAFSNLALSLAYQDRFDEAIAACDDGAATCKDTSLQKLRDNILDYVSKKPKNMSRGVTAQRWNSSVARMEAFVNGTGRYFNNEFDAVSVKGKRVDFKLDATEYAKHTVLQMYKNSGPIISSTNILRR